MLFNSNTDLEVQCSQIDDNFLITPRTLGRHSPQKYVWVRLTTPGFPCRNFNMRVSGSNDEWTPFYGKFLYICTTTEICAVRFKVIDQVDEMVHLRVAEVRSLWINGSGRFDYSYRHFKQGVKVFDQNLTFKQIGVATSKASSADAEADIEEPIGKKKRKTEGEQSDSSSYLPPVHIEGRKSPPRKHYKGDPDGEGAVVFAPSQRAPPAFVQVTPMSDVAYQYRSLIYSNIASFYRKEIEMKIRAGLKFDASIDSLKYKISVTIEEI